MASRQMRPDPSSAGFDESAPTIADSNDAILRHLAAERTQAGAPPDFRDDQGMRESQSVVGKLAARERALTAERRSLAPDSFDGATTENERPGLPPPAEAPYRPPPVLRRPGQQPPAPTQQQRPAAPESRRVEPLQQQGSTLPRPRRPTPPPPEAHAQLYAPTERVNVTPTPLPELPSLATMRTGQVVPVRTRMPRQPPRVGLFVGAAIAAAALGAGAVALMDALTTKPVPVAAFAAPGRPRPVLPEIVPVSGSTPAPPSEPKPSPPRAVASGIGAVPSRVSAKKKPSRAKRPARGKPWRR